MFRSDQWAAVPGFTTASETYENYFGWGHKTLGVIIGGQISGAARDSGNTPTTVLRPGLLLGQIAASSLLAQYSPTATDGTQLVHSILMVGVRMQDLDAVNQNRFPWMLVAGPIKAANLIGLDNVARRQMRGRFLFDDDYANKFGGGPLREVSKAADYVVVASDAGTLFTATAAVNFTLPALAAGLGPLEFLNLADSNMTVTSAAGDDIVWDNDAAADSLAFSTASHKIGGRLRFMVNAAGTKWYVENLSPATCTVTVVT